MNQRIKSKLALKGVDNHELNGIIADLEKDIEKLENDILRSNEFIEGLKKNKAYKPDVTVVQSAVRMLGSIDKTAKEKIEKIHQIERQKLNEVKTDFKNKIIDKETHENEVRLIKDGARAAEKTILDMAGKQGAIIRNLKKEIKRSKLPLAI